MLRTEGKYLRLMRGNHGARASRRSRAASAARRRRCPKRYTPVMRCVPRVVTSILIVLTTIAQLAPSRAGARIIAPPHQSGIVDPLSSAHNPQIATESRAPRFVSTPGFHRADSHSDLAQFTGAAVGRATGRGQPAVTPFSPQAFEPHSVRGRAPPISH